MYGPTSSSIIRWLLHQYYGPLLAAYARFACYLFKQSEHFVYLCKLVLYDLKARLRRKSVDLSRYDSDTHGSTGPRHPTREVNHNLVPTLHETRVALKLLSSSQLLEHDRPGIPLGGYLCL